MMNKLMASMCARLFILLLLLPVNAIAQDTGLLSPGTTVMVLGGPTTLYTQPGGGNRLTEIPANTVTKIVAGPAIIDGSRWWYITNNYGWVAEMNTQGSGLVRFDPAMLVPIIAEATSILTTDPNNADAYFRRGWAYFNQQDYDHAIEDLTQAIAIDPENPALYLASGKVYLDSGRNIDAIRDLTKALTLLPDDVAAMNRRGVAYQNLSDYQRASQDYNAGLQIAPDYGLLYYNLGNIARNTDNNYQALDLYHQALDLEPNLYQAHSGLGYAYVNMANYTTALAEFQQDLAHRPDDYTPYSGLGIAYEYMGDLETALNYYNQALALNDQNPFIYRSRGRLYYKLSRFGESADDLANAVEIAHDPAAEYNAQGLTYTNLEDYPAAIASYTKAVELGYVNAHWAIYNRGLVRRLAGEPEAALADFALAEEMVSGFAAPYLGQSDTLVSTGRYEEAIEVLNEAIASFPNVPDLYHDRAIIYDAYIHDRRKALADFEQAAALNPSEPDYQAHLGNLYFDMGMYDQSLAAYEQFVAMAGGNFAGDVDPILNRLDGLRAATANVEESGVEPLVVVPAEDSYDTFGHIVYGLRSGDTGPTTLYRIQSGGLPEAISQELERMGDITWSPDGQRIAFVGEGALYIMTPDGGTISTLVTANFPHYPRFSPDGTQIAYTAQDHIWKVNVDGSENTNLTAFFGAYEYFGERGFDWTPDGEHIIFTASIDTPGTPYGIFQMKADGSEMSVLLETPEQNMGVGNLQVAPNGHHVSFTPTGADTPIWIADLQTGAWQSLPVNGRISRYAWSPDGVLLVYSTRDSGMMVADVSANSAPVRIAGDVSEQQHVIAWIEGGQGLLFSACGGGCSHYTINLDGTGLTPIYVGDGQLISLSASPAAR